MGAVRSTAARARAHPRDDLERISGIGPAIARRLEHAGISTYEELAGRTADALSAVLDGLGGTSSTRIADNDWIGQARRLADPPPVSGDAHRTVSFGIDLELAANHAVRTTTVHDGQGGADVAWEGWDADRLLAALRPATTAPQPQRMPPRRRTSRPPWQRITCPVSRPGGRGRAAARHDPTIRRP